MLFGEYTLIVRSAMLETLGEDYILTARAKGLRPWTIVRKHALRNALLPVTTLIALSLGYIVAGAILDRDGLLLAGDRRAVYDAVRERDYPCCRAPSSAGGLGRVRQPGRRAALRLARPEGHRVSLVR